MGVMHFSNAITVLNERSNFLLQKKKEKKKRVTARHFGKTVVVRSASGTRSQNSSSVHARPMNFVAYG